MKAVWTPPSWQLLTGTVHAQVRSEGRTCEVMKGSKRHQGKSGGAKWRRKGPKGLFDGFIKVFFVSCKSDTSEPHANTLIQT